MLKKLEINNFLSFEDLEVNFSPTINVIIGENSIGKTILLKSILFLYSLLPYLKDGGSEQSDTQQFVVDLMKQIFDPRNEIVRFFNDNSDGTANLKADFENNNNWVQVIMDKSINSNCSGGQAIASENLPVFIPSKELMFVLPDLLRVANDYKHSLDATITGILENITRLDLQDRRLSELSRQIISKIEKIVGGKFFVDNNLAMLFTNQGYVQNSNVKSANIMAEGFREFGILSRLFETGTIVPGESGPLLWDEPAKNLNPKLMRSIAEITIEMARSQQQVILTTHNFVMLHWFKVLIDKDSDIQVRYHNLFRNEETSKIEVLSTDEYFEISSNAIVDAYEAQTLYEIEKSQKK